jgi:Sulfotransferase family
MASIFCEATRTVYYPAPKSASTSLRNVFYELDNGTSFKPFKLNGKTIALFWLYKNEEGFRPEQPPPGIDKIAVVRDPVMRFISFYTWAILKGRCPLPGVTDINHLVETLETHLEGNAMARFHLAPQHLFIGKDLSYFDRIFRTENLDELAAYLSERAGRPVPMQRENVTKTEVPPLTDTSMAKLRQLYAADIELLSGFYPA